MYVCRESKNTIMKEIKLTQGRVAIVDDEDYGYLNQWKWYFNYKKRKGGPGYAIRSMRDGKGKKRAIYMHIVVLDLTLKERGGLVVDHINRNSLDNRRCNLRAVTVSENNRNIGRRGKYGKGVSLRKCEIRKAKNGKTRLYTPSKPFVARIVLKGKRVNLGSFKTNEEASEAYRQASRKYYPGIRFEDN